MTDVLLHGDTVRSAALRHEVPLEIIDAVRATSRPAVARHPDRTRSSGTGSPRSARTRSSRRAASWACSTSSRSGTPRHEAQLEVGRGARRPAPACARRVVPPELPVAVADRLRADGIELTSTARPSRRAGGRSGGRARGHAARAARRRGAGWPPRRRCCAPADRRRGLLGLTARPLTAERVRGAHARGVRRAGAPAPPDVIVTARLSGGGHDPGAGPLPAACRSRSTSGRATRRRGCWADMTRTFVVGEPRDEVARAGTRSSARRSRTRVSRVRPGVTAASSTTRAATCSRRPGTRRSGPARRARPRDGFYFALGHGVGLEVHEAPTLGLAGGEHARRGRRHRRRAGHEGPGLGGVRLEDLVLVTETAARPSPTTRTRSRRNSLQASKPDPRAEGQLSEPSRSQR